MSKFTALTWIGGKSQLVGELTIIFSDVALTHDLKVFVDACTGGGTVITNAKNDVFKHYFMNDLDTGLVALHRTLQSRSNTAKLIIAIDTLLENALTPRRLFEESLAKSRGDEVIPELMKAAYTYISIYGSMHARRSSFDTIMFRDNFVGERKAHHKLHRFNSALSGVTITNRNLFELIEIYRDNPDVLIYMDVPYHPDAMAGNDHYGEFSWTVEMHQRLVTVLNDATIKMKWVLSGWENKDYKALTEDGFAWYYLVKNLKVQSSSKKVPKEEYIWTNAVISTSALKELRKLNNKSKGETEDISEDEHEDDFEYVSEIEDEVEIITDPDQVLE